MGTNTGSADPRIGVLGKANFQLEENISSLRGSSFLANAGIGVPSVWRSRGYLPHFDSPVAIQHVTFHLGDSLPKAVLQRMEAELEALPVAQRDAAKHKKIGAWIDAGHGACLLRAPAVARLVEQTVLDHDAVRYRLFAWVVMPNHVHVLFQPMNDWAVSKIVSTWKKFTATRIAGNANSRDGEKKSPVWHREYWDRFIRNEEHFQKAVDYIHQNPVKAGLVRKADEWAWSSAALQVAHKDANAGIGVPSI